MNEFMKYSCSVLSAFQILLDATGRDFENCPVLSALP